MSTSKPSTRPDPTDYVDRGRLSLQEAQRRRGALFAAFDSGDVDYLDAIAALGPYGDRGWVVLARDLARQARLRLRESPRAGMVLP